MTTVGELTAVATRLLRQAGMPDEPARRSAELLVLADVWGIGSHGLLRLPYYLARFRGGGLNPAAALRVLRDTGPIVSYDGADGLGHWQVWHAAEAGVARAREYGVAIASVGSSSHCGCLGLYTLPAVNAGLISLVFSTGPAVMAAPGTATPLLSTSPLAAGVPSQPRPAIVDLATTAVARGKIAAHAQRGEPLQEGWAVDATGTPTTDARAALEGMLAPLGGGKGFALAFMVEALAAGSVGPALSGDVPDMFNPHSNAEAQRIGHLVITFDPSFVAVDGNAQHRLDALAARVTAAGGRIPGASRTLPWDITEDTPVEIAESVRAELASWEASLHT
ncbi:Ldh family oxidoreductase [Actinobacteria bacterium YIM 96077]|uniref:Ldh family oxidoreductase n=2 Tax=Phytoactinopolyspora halophila TaxID=1981511 RepID=A0A329R0X6_9ACTN|nr:Ldh family oxidoreductase [Actinobacteria bacterium YIM 96077]RAW17589.1 Ldh family oxidoreductase [Phytoactinopolyspora halophila]